MNCKLLLKQLISLSSFCMCYIFAWFLGSLSGLVVAVLGLMRTPRMVDKNFSFQFIQCFSAGIQCSTREPILAIFLLTCPPQCPQTLGTYIAHYIHSISFFHSIIFGWHTYIHQQLIENKQCLISLTMIARDHYENRIYAETIMSNQPCWLNSSSSNIDSSAMLVSISLSH